MNWTSWAIWSFVATVVLISLLAGSQNYGISRMNLPFLLGTVFTPNRDKAKLIGFFIHFINGWIFSLVYVVAFESIKYVSWWFGALAGLVHAVFVLTVIMPILPVFHPRMASEFQDPTVVRQLEPPGFWGLHYGIRTPVILIVTHVIFGVILGYFYGLS